VNLQPELGSGPLSADLHVIGRDFGEHEARARQPFQGAAGQVLDKALAAAGFRRADVRVDNLIPKRPPGNDFSRHTLQDISWGQNRLRALLERSRPKLIVALGNETSAFLLGSEWPLTKRGTPEGIQATRGYLWDTTMGRVLTTIHPAAVLRDWTPWRALLDLDLRKAKWELLAGCPALPERAVTIVTEPSEVAELERAHCASWLSVDIENTVDLQLACVGFAPTSERVWVIPATEGWQLDAIKRLCESDVPKVLQNGQYDRFFLKWFNGIELRNQQFDAMLGWHALSPELAGKKTQVGARKKGYSRTTVKSLRFLISVYCRDRWHKTYTFEREEDRYILCGKDCCTTLEIAQKLAHQLEAQ